MTRATLQSDNTVYAQLTLDVGPNNVWQMAHRLGVNMSPDKPVASIGLGSLAVSPLDMAAAYATFPAMGIYAKPMAITKVILPGDHVDTSSGWGKPQTKRALSQGVAWKVNDVLQQNALYGTGRRVRRRHPRQCGQDGDDRESRGRLVRRLHAPVDDRRLDGVPARRDPDAGCARRQAVAGATFPVPIWHEYMAAALWHRQALRFELPNKYPTWHYLTRGDYGSFGYYSTPTYTTTTTATTTTTTSPVAPASHGTTTVTPPPPSHTTTAKQAPPSPPTTPAAPTTTEPQSPTTTASPPPSPGQIP